MIGAKSVRPVGEADPAYHRIDRFEVKICFFAFVATVAQLVRAPVCGTGGCGFNPRRSPHLPLEMRQ